MRGEQGPGAEALATIQAALAEVARPLPEDAERRWRAMDLAAAVEGCFHEQIDPDALEDEAAEAYAERLRGWFVIPPLSRAYPTGEGEARCWLVEAGRPVGAVKLSLPRGHGPWLYVHSLYVLPARRARGIATRFLERAAAAAVDQGLAGIRLGTAWTWQDSLRFYLDRGFYVYMWKHDLQLVLEPRLPRPRFGADGDAAHLDLVDEGGAVRHRLEARRLGDRLALEPFAPDDFELMHLATGTFAMHLAVRGWPLVRSEDDWARRYRWSDAGEPEGLAYKIGIFERVARDHRWVVETPTIRGLARWQAWAEGEEYGRLHQTIEDIERVLRARGWPVEPGALERLRSEGRFWALPQALRAAVEAASLDDWWAELVRIGVVRS